MTPKKTSKKQVALNKKDVKHRENSPRTTPTLALSTTATIPEKIDAEELFKQAIQRHKKQISSDKKNQFKELSQLALIAQEYLSTFAIVGYSLQDERVVIFNMPTPKDEAALVDLLRATFIEVVNNRP